MKDKKGNDVTVANNSAVAEKTLKNAKKTDVNSSATEPFSPSYAWIIWGAAALFYLYEYILRVSTSVMTNELMRDFGVTSTALGVLSAAYYYSYVPLNIPCGMIVDRFGARRVITISAILCTIGSFLFAASDTVFLASSARFIMGAGSACAYLSCLKVGSEWFAPQRFAVIAGTTMMMGTFGAIFGGKPFAMLVNATDWRMAMSLAGFVGIAVTAATWLIVRDHPIKSAYNGTKQESLFGGLKIIASNPQSWLIGIYAGLMYTILSAFAELWGTPYLMVAYEINNEMAAYGGMLVSIGMAVGCFVSPLISNHWRSHRKVMSIGAIGALLSFLPVIYVKNMPLYAVFSLLFFAGFFCGWQILNFAAAKEVNPPEYSGTTIGFTNALVMATAPIFQTLLGWLIDVFEEGILGPGGVILYSARAYEHALTAVPLCLLAAWVLMRFIRETHPLHASLENTPDLVYAQR